MNFAIANDLESTGLQSYVRCYERFCCLYLKFKAYIMYNCSRTSYVNSSFYILSYSTGRTVYDAERDLLAIAKCLVTVCMPEWVRMPQSEERHATEKYPATTTTTAS